jgi:hypothetical protein
LVNGNAGQGAFPNKSTIEVLSTEPDTTIGVGPIAPKSRLFGTGPFKAQRGILVLKVTDVLNDAAYMRGRALFCLALARQLSDVEAANNLKKEAMAYTLRAERLEEQAQEFAKDDAVRNWRTG